MKRFGDRLEPVLGYQASCSESQIGGMMGSRSNTTDCPICLNRVFVPLVTDLRPISWMG